MIDADKDMNPNSTEQAACTTLNQKLLHLSRAQSECTIYRVHRHLQDVNPKAYEPEVIAIGPYYRHRDHLQMMEDHKLRYLNFLLEQKTENDVQKYVAAIARVESQARKCYAEPLILNEIEFTEMLVLDGCFIIELVRKFDMANIRERKDPVFQMDWIINSLKRDLMLFENQIPYLILCELFDLIEVPNQRLRLTYLLLNFFKILFPGKGHREVVENDANNGIKHLLDLIHRSWIPADPLFHELKQGNRLYV